MENCNKIRGGLILAFRLATAFVEITTRDTGLQQGMNGALGKLQGMLGKMQALAAGAAAAFAGGSLIGAAIKAAADAEEIQSKFKAVFKEQTADTQEWAKSFADNVNRGVLDTVEKLSSFQDLFVPIGFERKEAAELSKALVTLTEDIASFNNMTSEDVALNLRSGLVGETEPLRKFGVTINQARLNTELLSMGIAGGVKTATEAQKVQGRLNLIMAATSDAQGDAARTSQSFTNRLKGLQGGMRDFLGAAGLPFIEFLSPIVGLLASSAKMFIKVNEALGGFPARLIAVTAGVAMLGIAVGALTIAFGGLAGAISAVLAVSGIGLVLVVVGAAIAVIVEAIRAVVNWMMKLEPVQEAWQKATVLLQEAWETFGRVFEKLMQTIAEFAMAALNTVMRLVGQSTDSMEEDFAAFIGQMIMGIAEFVASFAIAMEGIVQLNDRSWNIISLTAEVHLRRFSHMFGLLGTVMTGVMFGFNRTAKDAFVELEAEMFALIKGIEKAKKKADEDVDIDSKITKTLDLKVNEFGFENLISEFQKSQIGRDATERAAEAGEATAGSVASIDSKMSTLTDLLRGTTGGAVAVA